MLDETQSEQFSGVVEARVPTASEWGWRGGGPGSVTVGREGVEFRVYGLGRPRYQLARRGDLAYVYPVQARRWSVRSLVASSGTGVRFVTQPVGMFHDRDVYLFYSYQAEEWKLIDLLEALGYSVDRKPRTLRLFWGDEK